MFGTVMEQPSLGAFVKHLDIRQFESWRDYHDYAEAGDSRVLFGIGRRLGYTELQLSNAIRIGSCRLCVIILIGCLPNMSTLSLSMDFVARAERGHLSHALKGLHVL